MHVCIHACMHACIRGLVPRSLLPLLLSDKEVGTHSTGMRAVLSSNKPVSICSCMVHIMSAVHVFKSDKTTSFHKMRRTIIIQGIGSSSIFSHSELCCTLLLISNYFLCITFYRRKVFTWVDLRCCHNYGTEVFQSNVMKS